MIKLYVKDREWRKKFQVLTEEELKAIAQAMGWQDFVLIKDGGEIIPTEKLPILSHSEKEEVYWLYPKDKEKAAKAQCYTDQHIHDLLAEMEKEIVEPLKTLEEFYRQIEDWTTYLEENLPEKDLTQKKVTLSGKEYLYGIENGQFRVQGLPDDWEEMSIRERVLYIQLFKEYVHQLFSELKEVQRVLQKVALLCKKGCGSWA